MPRQKKIINPECGIRLKQVMEEKGVSGVQLSSKTNLSAVTISHYVRGFHRLTEESAQLIGNALGVLPEYLLCTSEYKTFEEGWKAHKDSVIDKRNVMELLLLSLGYEVEVLEAGSRVIRHNEEIPITLKEDDYYLYLDDLSSLAEGNASLLYEQHLRRIL